MEDLRSRLKECLDGRVCLMGIGNPAYGDDGFGVRLVEEIGWPNVINAGTCPERFIGYAAGQGYDRLLLLDAVELGVAPGSAVLLDSRELKERFPQVSTHKLSFSLLARWAEASGIAETWLLGVQPESLGPMDGLSHAVKVSLEALRHLLSGLSAEISNAHP